MGSVEDSEFMNGIGSIPISDLMWLLNSATKFKFEQFTVQKCAGWWEVHQEKDGFQKNPKHLNTGRIGNNYCFSLVEALEFVKAKL